MKKVMGRVAIIDDEENFGFVMAALLEQAGYEVMKFTSSIDALEVLAQEGDEIDVVITDLNMPAPTGMDVLAFLRDKFPGISVVILTAFGTVEGAVKALKSGAFDFLTKPFEREGLLHVVAKAVATARLKWEEPTISSVVGMSPSIQEIMKIIGKVAPSPSTVLLQGESGTGKEVFAHEIHRLSKRADRPFIHLNCAAIPGTLIESELFGHEKGAFTGASQSRLGRFELAHEGTLFLDEIGEIPLEMQAKFLRFLQDSSFQRLGGVQSINVDVRLIAATNRDLKAEVVAGRFREDLYYRINVVPIFLPALRDRRDDIEFLVQEFLQRFARKLDRKTSGIDTACLLALKDYHWPGNVRQLENVLERMLLLSDGPVLTTADLPEEIAGPPSPVSSQQGDFKTYVRRQTQRLEKDLIEKALQETNANVTRAAEKLGLSRKGLQLKMKELGLRRMELFARGSTETALEPA